MCVCVMGGIVICAGSAGVTRQTGDVQLAVQLPLCAVCVCSPPPRDAGYPLSPNPHLLLDDGTGGGNGCSSSRRGGGGLQQQPSPLGLPPPAQSSPGQ